MASKKVKTWDRAAWKAARVSAGKCIACKPGRLKRHPALCNECHAKKVKLNRRYSGVKPWRRGGVGRPPLTVKDGK